MAGLVPLQNVVDEVRRDGHRPPALAAARLLPEFSRTRLQQWIREGKLRVNGEIASVGQNGAFTKAVLEALEEGELLPRRGQIAAGGGVLG